MPDPREEQEEQAVRVEGWYGPPNSRRWHYFRGGRSLCQKWAVFMSDEDIPYDKAFGPADGDCAACKRALDKAPAPTGGS
jgi:hypothetical protein